MIQNKDLTVTTAMDEFFQTLAGNSPRTISTYQTGLRRWAEFLRRDLGATDDIYVNQLPDTVLEQFYVWLVKHHSRDRRATVLTYLAGARAFMRFLDRRRLLAPAVSYEQMRQQLRDVVGRSTYRTPRIDRGIPLILEHVDSIPLPESSPRTRRKRLELLRNRALLHTLFSTGLRRAETAALKRTDVEDGWARQSLVTGKGDKERVVFFGEDALLAIRAYLNERADRYLPLFLRHDKARGQPQRNGENLRVSALSIWRVAKAAGAAVNIQVSTHHFRHHKVKTLFERGARLGKIQEILGHASPETTTRIYDLESEQYDAESLQEAFDQYSVSAAEQAASLRDGTTPEEMLTSLENKLQKQLDKIKKMKADP